MLNTLHFLIASGFSIYIGAKLMSYKGYLSGDTTLEELTLMLTIVAYFIHLLRAVGARNALYEERNSLLATKTSKNKCCKRGLTF